MKRFKISVRGSVISTDVSLINIIEAKSVKEVKEKVNEYSVYKFFNVEPIQDTLYIDLESLIILEIFEE